MSTEQATNVVGYFNANPYSIYLEVNEANIKVELKPNEFIRDREGHYINDPIFEGYVQPKGLSRSTGKKPVAIRFVPRIVQPTRPAHSVTQATGFVRQPDGRVVPVYDQPPETVLKEVAVNKNPVVGMTVEKARKLGIIGKPRLISEDYGLADTTGAPPQGERLPDIKYSIESPPKVRTAAPLTPELMEADQDLGAAEIARRQGLQRTLNQAASTAPAEKFDPGRVRPLQPRAPVALKAPDEPTPIVAGGQPISAKVPAKPVSGAKKGVKAIKQAAQRILPRRRAAVVEEQPEQEEAQPEQETQSETALDQGDDSQSGVIQPLNESVMQPVLETPPAQASGRRFVCAADGKAFGFRSELARHVERKYSPEVAAQLMKPYPPESGEQQ
jgi:hypothetical protein